MPWYIDDMDDVPGDVFVPAMPENGIKTVLVLDSDEMTIVSFGDYEHDEAERVVHELRHAEGAQEWLAEDPYGCFVAALESESVANLAEMSQKQIKQVIASIMSVHVAEAGRWRKTDA